MLEAVAKNLWLLLTLVLPGIFTYGTWRLLLLLEPTTQINIQALAQIDSSGIASVSIIVAIALLQQAIAITIESILTLLAKVKRNDWPNYYSLFCERFELAASGKLDDNATRIIGNFFLSVNMSIGLLFLLLYFMAYEELGIMQWIPISIIVLLAATLISTVFRMFNAKWTIAECKK